MLDLVNAPGSILSILENRVISIRKTRVYKSYFAINETE